MVKLLKQSQNLTLFAFLQGGKSEIFVDVIERLSVVIGSNVSNPDRKQHSFQPSEKNKIIRLTCWSNAAGGSDEGRRGGGGPSQVLHAELFW